MFSGFIGLFAGPLLKLGLPLLLNMVMKRIEGDKADALTKKYVLAFMQDMQKLGFVKSIEFNKGTKEMHARMRERREELIKQGGENETDSIN